MTPELPKWAKVLPVAEVNRCLEYAIELGKANRIDLAHDCVDLIATLRAVEAKLEAVKAELMDAVLDKEAVVVEWHRTDEDLTQVKAERDRLRGLLQEVEAGLEDYCPICQRLMSRHDHTPDCELATALASAPKAEA